MLKSFFCIVVFLAAPLIADTEKTPAATPAPVEAPAPTPAAPPLAPIVPMHSEPTVPEVAIPEYQGAFIKMFLTLIGLVVAIFFTVWALKRLSRGRLHQMNSTRSIKILERRPLSAKTILYLVEVAGKQAMIAESQLEVKRILVFEDFTESEKTE